MELHAHTCLAALVAGEQSHISLQPLSSPRLLKVSGSRRRSCSSSSSSSVLTYIYLPFPFVCCGREAWKAAAMEVCSVGLKANVCFSQVMRRSVGSGESGIWGDGIGGGLKIKEWETKVVKGVKRRSSSGAAVAVLTSDVNQETMVSDSFVASIILGGGAGTQLFPLTSTRATPAVRIKAYNKQVLAATQTPGDAGMNWFQGTADAVRQFTWVFEVSNLIPQTMASTSMSELTP
ncbi:hypothetical protein B296_00036156 [Ensete ventricosum]|uniref:glucose-1-phosphate adenylyltransferase n=1 Tax=Ensete ventricosum TaxID=4639 RepID=A0A427A3I1_ENSVE|nr:hypothetical protein B296_00036156 [Ensete ventricosum]